MTRRLTIVLVAVAMTAGCSRRTWDALPLGTKAAFRDIYFADALHGWIAGGSHEITGGLIGRTTDGGKTWRFSSNLTSRDRMSAGPFHFLDAERGLVATGTGVILSTTDGGASWTPVSRRGRSSGISALFFLDDRQGWAAGIGDVLHTDDGGQTWTSLTPEGVDPTGRSPIRAIWFSDARNGVAAGMHSFLARTADGGATWEPVTIPHANGERPDFWDMTFVDSQFGWLVGAEGTILSTTDGGTTWTRQDTGVEDAHSAPTLERIPRAGGSVLVDAGGRTPGLTISAVRFIDRTHGWITGFYANLGRSLILRTEDGGAIWRVEAEIAGEELYALFIQGREVAWAIGARTREGPQAIYRLALDGK
jgi:photosystem II stability/assembly factor-like uncharacterized protein